MPFVAGRTEHRDVVFHRVALERPLRRRCAGRILDLVQDAFELHDCGRRHVALLAQARAQQIVRGLALRLAHRADGQAVAREHLRRDKSEVFALGRVLEREGRGFFLFGRERREELVRSIGHGGRRPIGRIRGRKSQDAGEPDKKAGRANSAHTQSPFDAS